MRDRLVPDLIRDLPRQSRSPGAAAVARDPLDGATDTRTGPVEHHPSRT